MDIAESQFQGPSLLLYHNLQTSFLFFFTISYCGLKCLAVCWFPSYTCTLLDHNPHILFVHVYLQQPHAYTLCSFTHWFYPWRRTHVFGDPFPKNYWLNFNFTKTKLFPLYFDRCVWTEYFIGPHTISDSELYVYPVHIITDYVCRNNLCYNLDESDQCDNDWSAPQKE